MEVISVLANSTRSELKRKRIINILGINGAQKDLHDLPSYLPSPRFLTWYTPLSTLDPGSRALLITSTSSGTGENGKYETSGFLVSFFFQNLKVKIF